jgi:hypothetical protein
MTEFRAVLSRPLPVPDEADRHDTTATWLSTELTALLTATSFDACRFISTLDSYVDEKIKAALARKAGAA